MTASAAKPPRTRRNCCDCLHFRRTDQGSHCRFRGGKPSGICAVFTRVPPVPAE